MKTTFNLKDKIKLTGHNHTYLLNMAGKVTGILYGNPEKYVITMSNGLSLTVWEHEIKHIKGSFEVVYNNKLEKIKLLYEQRKRKDGSSYNVFRLLYNKRQLTLKDYDLFNAKYYQFIKYFDYIVTLEIEKIINQLRFN